MQNITGVSLQFNCREKLNQNNFCEQCRRSVTDFRNKADSDLRDAIRESKGHVCGIFNKSQLSERFLKYAAATVIATSLAILTRGQEANKVNTIVTKCKETGSQEQEVLVGVVVQTHAEPRGGFTKFVETIKSKIVYPPGLVEKGKTYVELIIDSTGQMKDVKILRGFNEAADKEALRVMSSLNYPFNPARQDGKPFTSRFIIPVIFDPSAKAKK